MLITKELRATAIGKLKHHARVEDVANDLSLPVALVQEWRNGMSERDFAKTVSEQVGPGEVARIVMAEVDAGNVQLDKLKDTLEQGALKLAEEVINTSVISFDLERARTLNLLGSTLSTLYATYFGKGNTVNNINVVGSSGGAPMSRFIQKA